MITADIADIRKVLLDRFETLEDKASILRSPELKELFVAIKDQPAEKRGVFGAAVNELKKELDDKAKSASSTQEELTAIDVTAPLDSNNARPSLLPTEQGSVHPLMRELENVLDIFYRMGFETIESREIDDEYHMFTALNFPAGHPARDEYDTFLVKQTDKKGEPLVAPAHTSIMQLSLIHI